MLAAAVAAALVAVGETAAVACVVTAAAVVAVDGDDGVMLEVAGLDATHLTDSCRHY